MCLTAWCRTNQRHRVTIWQEGRDRAYEAIEAANQPAKSEEHVVLALFSVSVAGGSHESQHAACDKQAARWGVAGTNEQSRPIQPATEQSDLDRNFAWVSGLSRGPSEVRRSKGSALGPCDGAGSQVGSHSPWTAPDGRGRLWTRKPALPRQIDTHRHPWTPLGDLRIRRLGVRVPPRVQENRCGTTDATRCRTDGPSDIWEPFARRITAAL